MKAYKLKFHTPLHIDAGNSVVNLSETYIHSDTLFSAIVSASRKLYDDKVAEKFLEPRAMVLSSAFPFYKNELFFPKPLHFFPENLNEYEMIKVFKKAKFFSKEHLLNILNGQNIDSKYFSKNYFLNGCWRQVENTKTADEVDLIFDSIEIPHIIIDRITNQTQIFYTTEIFFNKDAGLFFLADVKEELISVFETTLRFLGDEGIGSDRTYGKGLFEVEVINDLTLPKNHHSNYYYLISLYSPTREEFEKIEPKKSFYDFVIRSGWVSNNTLNRKQLRMFVEGSILKFNDEQKPVGCLHKVLEKKDFPADLSNDIFRSGQALFLPLLGGFDEKN